MKRILLGSPQTWGHAQSCLNSRGEHRQVLLRTTFSDEDTEAQKSWINCSGSHSIKWLSGPTVNILTYHTPLASEGRMEPPCCTRPLVAAGTPLPTETLPPRDNNQHLAEIVRTIYASSKSSYSATSSMEVPPPPWNLPEVFFSHRPSILQNVTLPESTCSEQVMWVSLPRP